MSNQSTDLTTLKASHPTKEVNAVKGYIAYNKGQGYVLSLSPGEISGGCFSCEITHWKNSYKLIERSARFNRKTLESLALTVKETEVYKTMVEALTAQGVTISDEPFKR